MSLEAFGADVGMADGPIRQQAPAVSVIIPVYDTESFVGEALASVQAQSFRDIEIICVNDGSTDGSLRLLRDVAQHDPRIIVHDQENRGLSGARNQGMSLARGEYLLFLDSDDMLGEGALEALYCQAREERLDMLLFDAEPFASGASMGETLLAYESYYRRGGSYSAPSSGLALMAQLSRNGEYLPSACLYLLKRSLVQDGALLFHEGILHEDNAFTFVALAHAKRAALAPHAFYRRRLREGSITQAPTFANCRGLFACYVDMLRAYASFLPRLEAAERGPVMEVATSCLRQARKTYALLTPEQRAQARAEMATIEGEERALLEAEVMIPGQCMSDLREASYHLDAFESSPSYRLGRALTWPLRQVRSFLRGEGR